MKRRYSIEILDRKQNEELFAFFSNVYKTEKDIEWSRRRTEHSIHMTLSGNHNKRKRQKLIEYCTGEIRPISECGIHNLSDAVIKKIER